MTDTKQCEAYANSQTPPETFSEVTAPNKPPGCYLTPSNGVKFNTNSASVAQCTAAEQCICLGKCQQYLLFSVINQ